MNNNSGESARIANGVSLVYSFKFWALTIILSLIYSSLIFAQNVVYIDPTNSGDPAEDGSIDHPYDTWDDVFGNFQDNTSYLQKRGTTLTLGLRIRLNQVNNVTLGAYGTGPKPTIIATSNNDAIVTVTRSSHCTVQNLNLVGTGNNVAGVNISGSAGSGQTAYNTVVDSVLISYCYNGIRSLPFATDIDNITIKNTVIHHIREDGIYIDAQNTGLDSVFIVGCHIYDVNTNWWTGQVAPGDVIQLIDVNHWLIQDCILDKRNAAEKFNVIISNVYTNNNIGRMIGNTIYSPKDTATASTTCVWITGMDTVWVLGNKFIGRGIASGGRPGSLSYMTGSGVAYWQYNLIDNIRFGVMAMDGNTYYSNNTWLYYEDGNGSAIANIGDSIVGANNVFLLPEGVNPATFGSMCDLENSVVINSNDHQVFQDSLKFADFMNQDYHLTEDSYLRNNGGEHQTLLVDYDLDSIPVPLEDVRDIGPYEYSDGPIINVPPSIQNQNFNLNENSSNGVQVGTVIATDPDPDQTLSYSILSGNTSGAFAINAGTGVLTVSNSAALNYESINQFNLIVEVQDNGPGNLTDQATVTVFLNDVNELPVIEDQTFYLNLVTNQFTADIHINAAELGHVVAADPDMGQSLSFQIIAGNEEGIWELDNENGLFSVPNIYLLEFSAVQIYELQVEVTDDGQQPLSASGEITIVVEITDFFANESTSWAQGQQESDEQIQFHMFPNPADVQINLEIQANDYNPVQLRIYAMNGSLVWEKQYLSQIEVIDDRVDISGLQEGIYLVELNNALSSARRKLVVK